MNEHTALNREQSGYKDLPVFAKVETNDILKSYLQVKQDVAMIVQIEIERTLDALGLNVLIIKKNFF